MFALSFFFCSWGRSLSGYCLHSYCSTTLHMGQITLERQDGGEGWQRGRPLAIVPSEIKVLSDDLSASIIGDENLKVSCPRIASFVPEPWTRTRSAY